jgi:DNA-binding protein YbaB
MIGDLEKVTRNLDEGRRRIRQIQGVAWSPDRLIKAVVGPRGQLIDLEIDPRVYRNPNSKALSASILATVRSAVEDSMRQGKEVRDGMIPKDLRKLAEKGRNPDDPLDDPLNVHDADLGDRDG